MPLVKGILNQNVQPAAVRSQLVAQFSSCVPLLQPSSLTFQSEQKQGTFEKHLIFVSNKQIRKHQFLFLTENRGVSETLILPILFFGTNLFPYPTIVQTTESTPPTQFVRLEQSGSVFLAGRRRHRARACLTRRSFPSPQRQ